jgi:hypothetical protein
MPECYHHRLLLPVSKLLQVRAPSGLDFERSAERVYFLALGALAWPSFLDLRRLIVLMRTCLRPQPKMLRLAVDKVRDRAHVVVRGEGGDSLAGIIDRKKGGEGVVALPGGPEHGKMTRIDIILEAMGRANYGPFMGGERKGITQGRFRPCPQTPYYNPSRGAANDLSLVRICDSRERERAGNPLLYFRN